VAAIAIPQLQNYATNSRLKSAARDIMGDFFLYKERAISENRMYRIIFNVGANNYTIEQCNATGSSCAAWTVIQTKTPASFGSNISINGPGTTVTTYIFQPRGTVTNGTLRLINNRNSTATITINITGKVSVQFNMQ
jgi:Tfp pilus assembly protein FimT